VKSKFLNKNNFLSHWKVWSQLSILAYYLYLRMNMIHLTMNVIPS